MLRLKICLYTHTHTHKHTVASVPNEVFESWESEKCLKGAMLFGPEDFGATGGKFVMGCCEAGCCKSVYMCEGMYVCVCRRAAYLR